MARSHRRSADRWCDRRRPRAVACFSARRGLGGGELEPAPYRREGGLVIATRRPGQPVVESGHGPFDLRFLPDDLEQRPAAIARKS